MNAATQAKLWYWQRISAMVLAICVVAHLATIVYVTRGGLSAGELLARTRGSALVASFYGVFVIACAVHVPIGLRTIAAEWLGWRDRSASWAALLFGVVLLFMGLRAVYAVVGG